MSKVCQLFSGSSGNSIYVGSSSGGVLIDIGVSAKRCENKLKSLGVQPESIRAILITHEHYDHIAGVRVFASRHGIPVFAPPASLEEMRFSGVCNSKVNAFEFSGILDLGDIIAEGFRNSHDSADCFGYKLSLSDGRKVSVCTDTGYITDEAKQALCDSDLVFLESNHEISMLQNGAYPYHLKQRILSAKGHLSNYAAGEFSKELLSGGTTRFVLSHLSRENNIPEIARQTVVSALSELGARENFDYRLYVSEPENNGGFIIL